MLAGRTAVRWLVRRQQRLRLVEVGLSWPPESFLVLKLQGLAGRGLDVGVATFIRADEQVPALPGIRLVRLPHWEDSPARARIGLFTDALRLVACRPFRALRLLAAVRRRPPAHGLSRQVWRVYVRLARIDADAFHIEWVNVALFLRPLLDVWRRPVVFSLRGSDIRPDEQMRLWAPPAGVPELFSRASAVHVVSDSLGRQVRRYGVDPDRTWLINPAVDATFFRPHAERVIRVDSFVIICVGALRWLKAFEYALLALSHLVRDGVPATLEIVGADPPPDAAEPGERARLAWTAEDLAVSDRLRLPGHLTPAEVCDRLQRADVFLQTSVSEGLPNVVLEAMACGLPVVATDVNGTSEAVRDGIDGYLVPPRDPDAMASALRALWDDPELRGRLGESGRARVEEAFTLDRQTDRWVHLYSHVCKRTRNP